MNKTRNIVIICILLVFIGIFSISMFNGNTDLPQDPPKEQEIHEDSTQTVQKEETNKQETSKDEIKEEAKNESNQSNTENKKNPEKPKEESKDKTTEKQEQANKNDVPNDSSSNVDSEGTKEETVEKEPVNLIEVSVVIKGLNGMILANEKIQIEEKISAFDALKAVCDKNGLAIITNGYGKFVYVRSIDGLMEKQHGATSGWKYNVNGNYINVGSGQYVLLENDVMEWYYEHD